VRVVASLLPKQTEKLANPLADLTDDELDKLDAFLATIRGPMMPRRERAERQRDIRPSEHARARPVLD
jgi:hypothetical protein